MPLYTFENKRTGKTFTEMMSISEMESYLKKINTLNKILQVLILLQVYQA